jgi:hypothetical protein
MRSGGRRRVVGREPTCVRRCPGWLMPRQRWLAESLAPRSKVRSAVLMEPPMGPAMAGTKAASRSWAGRAPRGLRVSSAEFREPPREYATGGVPAVNPDGCRVDFDIAGMTNGGLGDQRRCGSPKPASFVFLSGGWVPRDQLAFFAWSKRSRTTFPASRKVLESLRITNP